MDAATFDRTIQNAPLAIKPDAIRVKADWVEEMGEDATALRLKADLLPTIADRVAALVIRADEISAEYHTRMGFTSFRPDRHEAKAISEKWYKVDSIGVGSRSVYCFVARQDFENKELGKVIAGGIYMAASYKKPAKHVRGSVFQEDFGGCLNQHGVNYLRG